MKRHDNQFWDSALMNNYTYLQYYNRLMELSCSMFEWKNLPDSVDERFLELALFADGHALFFQDKSLSEVDGIASDTYLALRCALLGRFNVYNIPMERQAFASNGYNKHLSDKDSVIIWNNYLHQNSMIPCEMYAKRLYNLDRIIDVNANAQKTPVLVRCSENQLLTMKNVYMKVDGNMPVIFGDNDLNPNAIQAINTGAPYVADKIYQLKTQIWNEALTYLGISNVNTQKKERLITDEAIRQEGGTIASRYSRLQARREAAEQINKMFGLKIEVNFRADYREANDEYMLPDMTRDSGELVPMVTDLRSRTNPGGI